MEKQTLYEILEVSENASAEVIEKAYKVLVKKYHPDLQEASEKQKAEDKMKKINEAYDVLGDEAKRRAYDEELRQEREAEKARYYQEQNFQNTQQKQEQNYYYEDSYSQSGKRQNQGSYKSDFSNENQQAYDYEEERLKYQEKLRKEELKQRKKMQENLNKEYENAYYNYLRSLGYKVKHKWTKQNFIDLLIVLAIMAVIITALWLIPPSHDWMVNFYESNPIIKTIIDIIGSIVIGIFKGIWNFITGLFS